MKKIIITFFTCLISAGIMQAQSTLNFGVNLAGAEFGSTFPGVYDTDYTYPSNSVLDYYNSKGLKLIRLPIKWERIQTTMNAALNTAELNRLTSVIDYANTKGMKVIVDMHNYCRRVVNGNEKIIGSNGLPVANIKDCWTRLATALKTKTNIFAYDIMNEPHDMGSTSWFTIAQQIINGIRSTDLTTTIIVSGDDWSSGERWLQSSDNLKDLVDVSDNLIFQAHIYFDADASGEYAGSYDAEGAYPNVGVDRATPFVNWLNTNGLRGYVGEYGIPGDDARWNVVLTNFLTYIKSNCVNGTYWAGGEWWGDYNLSVEPDAGVDKPQMAILLNFLTLSTSACGVYTSVSDVSSASSANVFPNPANNNITIQGLGINDHIQIFNVEGVVVKDIIYTNTTSFDISDLNSGMYFISINSTQNTKFIKE